MPRSTTISGGECRASAATACRMRSAPTSCGSSQRDRDSCLHVRPDDERLAAEAVAADGAERGLEDRDGGGDGCAANLLRLDAEATQLVGEIACVLGGGAVGIRGHAQARGEVRPVVDADRDARVADVDGEKQGGAPEGGAGGTATGGGGRDSALPVGVGSRGGERADYTQFIQDRPAMASVVGKAAQCSHNRLVRRAVGS